MYFINVFFLFSIGGFIFETFLSRFFHGVFESGILFGPWTPIYGIGVVIIFLIHNFLDKRIKNKFLKPLFLFLLSIIILTILEWIGGMFLELVFNKVYWSYENMRFNLGHYISLEVSLIWGILSLILIYVLKKLIDKIEKYIPKWLTYLLLCLFFVDLVVTLIIK